MAEITVSVSEAKETYECDVKVQEAGGQTEHTVTVKKTDYERLTEGSATPKELVAESFRFLLEREPKESILRSFDLTVINRYFPEYEREIKQRL
jgi:hypothetical protein